MCAHDWFFSGASGVYVLMMVLHLLTEIGGLGPIIVIVLRNVILVCHINYESVMIQGLYIIDYFQVR